MCGPTLTFPPGVPGGEVEWQGGKREEDRRERGEERRDGQGGERGREGRRGGTGRGEREGEREERYRRLVRETDK